MKLWIKTFFKNIVALTILIPIGSYAGYNYYQIINSKIKGVGDPIGVVQEKSYYPKRQLSNDEYISTLSENDDLFEGDRIKSDAFSSVLMNLVDGSKVSLENGSEIILRLKEDTIYFSGTISINSSENRAAPLTLIDLNDKNAKPIILDASTELTLATDDRGIFRMSVLSGEASRGEEVVKENEQFQIAPTGETQVQALSYILESPENNSRYVTFTETQKVSFRWSEPSAQTTRSLWVARDANFERVVYRADNLTDLTHRVDLEPGDYFWRVGREGADQYSSIGKILIQKDHPLAASSPADGTTLTYRTREPSQVFLWKGTETAQYWLFELSRNQDMSDVIQSSTLSYNQIRVDDLAEGSYWWRVTAQYQEVGNVRDYVLESPLKLQVNRNVILEPPQLLSPDYGDEIPPLTLNEGVRFSWKGDPEYTSYEIAISENENMTAPFFIESTERTYATVVTAVSYGEYYWQVTPQSDSGQSASPSEVRLFLSKEKILELSPLYPLSGTPIEMTQGSSLSFRWDSNHEGSYRYRLWKLSGEGEQILVGRSETSLLEMSQYIPDRGEYVWEVDLIDSNSRTILEGNKQFFSTDYPLAAPQIIEPAPDSRVTMVGETDLTVSWTSVLNGSSYSGQILKEGEKEPVFIIEKQAETDLIVDVSDFSPGLYTIEVISNRLDEGRGFSTESAPALSSFFLEEVVNYRSPVITSPEENGVVNRLNLIEGGLPVSWTSSFNFPSYEFVVKQTNSGSIILKQSIVGEEYLLSDLYAGAYTIEVSGKDSKGRLSPVGTRNIRVLPVANLRPPRVIFPTPNQVVDMSERNELAFSWAQDTEGELYNISLQDSQRNILFTRRNYSLTSFTFSDLSKLDVGEFIFTIESVKEYRDSGIKRESDTAEIYFEITIDSSIAAPTIISPEVQYAE